MIKYYIGYCSCDIALEKVHVGHNKICLKASAKSINLDETLLLYEQTLWLFKFYGVVMTTRRLI